MKYSIKVNEVRAKEVSNIKGFATVVFGDSFKITNIAILENKDKGELFVSMPRYRSNERDESNGVIYKDVCNPITAEFREELYTNILDAYARIREPEKEETQKQDRTQEMPEFSVTVTPYEREGSNIKGLARIYFENSFIVNHTAVRFHSHNFLHFTGVTPRTGMNTNGFYRAALNNRLPSVLPLEALELSVSYLV